MSETTRSGEFSMLIVGNTIVLVGRRYRSKWWGVTCCGCSAAQRRKDGSCKHERAVMESLRPEIQRYARIEKADTTPIPRCPGCGGK